jgi:DNA-binding PadR family transcriptional regulator
LLKRLNQAEYVDVTVEQEGNRPPKQVYSITTLGQKKFGDMLKSALTHIQDITPAGDIGVMFLDHLPSDEVIDCLQERLMKVEDLLSTYERTPQHGHGIGVDLSIQHRIALFKTDRDWLNQAIERISKETWN